MSQFLQSQFPRLKEELNPYVLQEKGPGYSETYPPWEDYNPHPGTWTVGLRGNTPIQSTASELLHGLGSIDPRSGGAIDPHFYAMKQRFMKTLTPRQRAMDQRAYAQEQREEPSSRSFQDWMDQSRGDAYLRALLFPQENPEWKNVLTPVQQSMSQEMMDWIKSTSFDMEGRHG